MKLFFIFLAFPLLVQSIHQCFICDASFSRKSILVQHLSSKHLGIRHECSLCPKSFSRTQDLKRHIESKHGNPRPYRCIQCPSRFSRKDVLQKHTKKRHLDAFCFTCGSIVNKDHFATKEHKEALIEILLEYNGPEGVMRHLELQAEGEMKAEEAVNAMR